MEREQNKRPRRTSLEIKNLLSSFTQSGLSVKAFCQIHSISEAAFYKWKSRYTVTPSENQPGFITLHSSGGSLGSALFAEVRGIKIYQAVASSYLKDLLV